MTEREWLSSKDPSVMLLRLRPDTQPERSIVSDRKLRLWIAAMRSMNIDAYYAKNLISWQAGERFQGDSDGELSEHVAYWSDNYADQIGDPSLSVRAALLRDIVGNPYRPVYWSDDPKQHAEPGRRTNPHPSTVPHVEIRMAWTTPTVLSLAQAAYDDCTPHGILDDGRLAVLSDALEEAGCDDESILWHLRGVPRDMCWVCEGTGVVEVPSRRYGFATDDDREDMRCLECMGDGVLASGPHVRGCWVLDCILGKD